MRAGVQVRAGVNDLLSLPQRESGAVFVLVSLQREARHKINHKPSRLARKGLAVKMVSFNVREYSFELISAVVADDELTLATDAMLYCNAGTEPAAEVIL